MLSHAKFDGVAKRGGTGRDTNAGHSFPSVGWLFKQSTPMLPVLEASRVRKLLIGGFKFYKPSGELRDFSPDEIRGSRGHAHFPISKEALMPKTHFVFPFSL